MSLEGLMQLNLSDYCPEVKSCCWCIPLRPSVFLISLIGFGWAYVYILGCTDDGYKFYTKDARMNHDLAVAYRCIHGIFGVFLIIIHIMLFVAAVIESGVLCETYIWCTVVFWVLVLAFMYPFVVSSPETRRLPYPELAKWFGSMTFCSVVLSMYFTTIVANYAMTLSDE